MRQEGRYNLRWHDSSDITLPIQDILKLLRNASDFPASSPLWNLPDKNKTTVASSRTFHWFKCMTKEKWLLNMGNLEFVISQGLSEIKYSLKGHLWRKLDKAIQQEKSTLPCFLTEWIELDECKVSREKSSLRELRIIILDIFDRKLELAIKRGYLRLPFRLILWIDYEPLPEWWDNLAVNIEYLAPIQEIVVSNIEMRTLVETLTSQLEGETKEKTMKLPFDALDWLNFTRRQMILTLDPWEPHPPRNTSLFGVDSTSVMLSSTTPTPKYQPRATTIPNGTLKKLKEDLVSIKNSTRQSDPVDEFLTANPVLWDNLFHLRGRLLLTRHNKDSKAVTIVERCLSEQSFKDDRAIMGF